MRTWAVLSTFVLLVLAGIAAGALTTVASLGGGILVIAFMSLVWPPATVLGVTAPALFVGNASRVAMLFREVDWRTAARFAVTAVPAAFLSSLVAASLPADTLKIVVAAFLLLFVAHELGIGRGKGGGAASAPGEVGTRWLAPVGGVIAGSVSGLAGGAGFIASPFLLKLGLSPRALVATSAACMAIIHLTKGAGFAMAQVLTPALAPLSAALAAGIVAGNALGTRILDRMSRETFRKILVLAVALAAGQLLYTAIF